MTRNDVRLLVAIVMTAVVASVFTVIVARLLAPSSTDARVTAVEQRVTALESPPPPARITVAPIEVPSRETARDVQKVPECDEVSCVLANYEPVCCAKVKRPGSSFTGTTLDRAMISAGIARIKMQVVACGDRSTAKGVVKVAVKVAPDGHVSAVTVKETPESTLGACVATALQHASFEATTSGGSFSYPFLF